MLDPLARLRRAWRLIMSGSGVSCHCRLGIHWLCVFILLTMVTTEGNCTRIKEEEVQKCGPHSC